MKPKQKGAWARMQIQLGSSSASFRICQRCATFVLYSALICHILSTANSLYSTRTSFCFSLPSSCFFTSSHRRILADTQPSLSPVIFHPGKPLGMPRSFSVLSSTKLYSSLFFLSKQKGSFNETGGFVMTRISLLKFFEAVCIISGCIRITSPTSPVISKKLSSRTRDVSLAKLFQKSPPSYVLLSGSLTDFNHGDTPSG